MVRSLLIYERCHLTHNHASLQLSGLSCAELLRSLIGFPELLCLQQPAERQPVHHAALPQLPACAEHLRRPTKVQRPLACSDLLSGSRTSRLYSRLVQAGKAYSADAVPYFPGEKHPNAFLLYALPSDALSLAQLQGAVQEQVQGLAASGPSGQELQRIKKV